MQKATIIYGSGRCGKTTMAKDIARQNGGAYFYGSANDIPYIKANLVNPFKTVIIDECPKDFDFESFFNLIIDLPFTQFVFVTEDYPKITGASFLERFELVDARELWDELPF